MGVIRSVEADRVVRDAASLHLGDLARQGSRLPEAARAQAESIVAEAQRERETLVQGAAERGHAEGREAGYAEGLEAGRAEGAKLAEESRREALAKIEASWLETLASIEAERAAMLSATRADLCRLAALVAEKVTKRVVSLDERVVVDQLGAVLAVLARPTRLTVAIHPDDERLLTETLPELVSRFTAAEHVELTPDATLERGSCVARTAEGGVIDASVRTQLDRLVEALLPAGEAMEDGEPEA